MTTTLSNLGHQGTSAIAASLAEASSNSSDWSTRLSIAFRLALKGNPNLIAMIGNEPLTAVKEALIYESAG